MIRREFLKLVGAIPFAGLAGGNTTLSTDLSREEMFRQLYILEDSLNTSIYGTTDKITILMSQSLLNALRETMLRTTGTTNTALLFGLPVVLSPFLPYEDSKGNMVHAVGWVQSKIEKTIYGQTECCLRTVRWIRP